MKLNSKILFNIILIVGMIIAADFLSFYIEKKKYIAESSLSGGIFDTNQIVHFAPVVPESNLYIEEDRHALKQKDNSSILLLGCSYTYGAGLTPMQNFSYYLSNSTNKTVYNLGISGGNISQPLFLSQNKDFSSKYPNVQLIIYTYIEDHINRTNEYLKCEIYNPYCNFRLKKDKENYKKMNEWYRFPSSFFLFRMILKTITHIKNSGLFYNLNVKHYAAMVNQTKRNFKLIYPDANFIFMFYYNDDKDDISKFLDKDIIILKTGDFTNVNLAEPIYKHDNDPHPTEQVWIDIVPDFVKFLRSKKLL